MDQSSVTTIVDAFRKAGYVVTVETPHPPASGFEILVYPPDGRLAVRLGSMNEACERSRLVL